MAKEVSHSKGTKVQPGGRGAFGVEPGAIWDLEWSLGPEPLEWDAYGGGFGVWNLGHLEWSLGPIWSGAFGVEHLEWVFLLGRASWYPIIPHTSTLKHLSQEGIY